MFESYSIPARRVIFIALHLAQHAGADFIGMDHIVLALIYEDQDRVREALERPDLMVSDGPVPRGAAFLALQVAAKLIDDFKTLIGAGKPLPGHPDMPLALEAKHMLASAHELAGGRTLEPLHLLAAALDVEESRSSAVLREAGVEKEAVLKAIQQA